MKEVFSIPVRVYYEDTDAGGIVYHANYLKYMERCRSEWLHAAGCDVERVRERFGILFAVHRVTLEYLLPAKLWDDLSVTLSILKLGKVTLDLEQSVQRGGESLCKGMLRLASLDSGSLKPRAMPERLLDLVNSPAS
jgi:acyl-CoA thioester hydrolase